VMQGRSDAYASVVTLAGVLASYQNKYGLRVRDGLMDSRLNTCSVEQEK
jgi:hypothetical protein